MGPVMAITQVRSQRLRTDGGSGDWLKAEAIYSCVLSQRYTALSAPTKMTVTLQCQQNLQLSFFSFANKRFFFWILSATLGQLRRSGQWMRFLKRMVTSRLGDASHSPLSVPRACRGAVLREAPRTYLQTD